VGLVWGVVSYFGGGGGGLDDGMAGGGWWIKEWERGRDRGGGAGVREGGD